MVTAAALCSIALGLGFGLPLSSAVLLYHRERGELPMSPFGWRLLGGP